MPSYPKRLIEIDLPILRRISAHARREKSTRRGHGHISTLHIWWARRPLAACRAVICAMPPEVHPIQNPARLEWKAVMGVEHYRVDAGQVLYGGE